MKIKTLYKTGRPVVSLEVFPPKKDSDISGIYMALEQMSALKPDFISVTYGAGGSGSVNKTAEVASSVQNQYGIPALAHLTCIGANRARMQELLDDMRADGIENVLALRGDFPETGVRGGDYLFAEELIHDVRARGSFCVGAACYPEGHIDCESLEFDAECLRRKQEAGADFLITQLFFDNDVFFRFLERIKKAGITLPVSAGVMPILSKQQISRMIFLCGASLPSSVIRLLHKHEKSPDDLFKAGVELAAAQMEQLLSQGADGIHIYTMNKPQIAEYCVRHIGRM